MCLSIMYWKASVVMVVVFFTLMNSFFGASLIRGMTRRSTFGRRIGVASGQVMAVWGEPL